MSYSSTTFFMRYLLYFSLLLLSTCTKDNDTASLCPYELNYGGHYLRVPVTVEPHQLTYRVGDTLRISTIFSDSIYDLSTEETFKIQNFPFKPVSLLYRFYDGMEWDAGYSVNELYIPEEYEHVFFNSANYADHFRAYSIYEDEQYRFDMTLVLREPGRYVMIFSDLYEDQIGSNASTLNAEANAIDFVGKCPHLSYQICSVLEGDSHMNMFEPELLHLDDSVYNGHFTSISSGSNNGGIYGAGLVAWEFRGTFGFEVVE